MLPIYNFIFVIFSSHVVNLILFSSFPSDHVDHFEKFQQTELIKQKCVKFIKCI